jgi:hypothetical protein
MDSKPKKFSRSNLFYTFSLTVDIISLTLAFIGLLLGLYDEPPTVSAGSCFGCFDISAKNFATTCDDLSNLQLLQISASRHPTVSGVDIFNVTVILFVFLLLTGFCAILLLPIHSFSTRYRNKKWKYVKMGVIISACSFLLVSIVFIIVIGTGSSTISNYSQGHYSNVITGSWTDLSGQKGSATLGDLSGPFSVVSQQQEGNQTIWTWEWVYSSINSWIFFRAGDPSFSCQNATEIASGQYTVSCQTWLELIPTLEQFEDALPALSNSLQLSFILGLISLISVFLGIFVISILLVIEKKVDQPEESVGELELEEESRWF